MTRAFLARALRSLASLVAGDDPSALAIAEAARARAEAERAVDLARLALTSAERAASSSAARAFALVGHVHAQQAVGRQVGRRAHIDSILILAAEHNALCGHSRAVSCRKMGRELQGHEWVRQPQWNAVIKCP